METVNGCLSDRLDEMEAAIRKTSFRKGTGRANEVNYWVFDYPPEKELEVRARIEYMKGKNARGDDDFDLVVFDLYDVIIGFLDENSLVRRFGYEREISQLKEEIEKYRADYEENTKRLNEISTNPDAIEQIAREKYLMKKPNEDIYVFED